MAGNGITAHDTLQRAVERHLIRIVVIFGRPGANEGNASVHLMFDCDGQGTKTRRIEVDNVHNLDIGGLPFKKLLPISIFKGLRFSCLAVGVTACVYVDERERSPLQAGAEARAVAVVTTHAFAILARADYAGTAQV